MPLAIEQAGAYLRKGLPLTDFHKILSDNLESVIKVNPKASEWAYNRNRGVHAILELLHSQLSTAVNIEPSLLAWIALLSPGEVSINALRPTAFSKEQGLGNLLHLWREPLQNHDHPLLMCTHFIEILEDPEKFWTALSELEDSCIIRTRRRTSGEVLSVSLHNIVRQWAIKRVEPREYIRIVLFAMCILSSNFNDIGGEEAFFTVHRSLGPCVQNLVTMLQQPGKVDRALISPPKGPLAAIYNYCASRLVSHFMHINKHQEALKMVQDIIEYETSKQNISWPVDERSLKIIETLGDCLKAIGRLEEARATYADLLGHSMCTVGEDEPLALCAARKLRETKAQIGIHEPSRKQILEAIPYHGSQSRKSATNSKMENQYPTFSAEEEYPYGDEEYHLKEQLSLTKAEFGPRDPLCLSMVKTLGSFYYEKKDF